MQVPVVRVTSIRVPAVPERRAPVLEIVIKSVAAQTQRKVPAAAGYRKITVAF